MLALHRKLLRDLVRLRGQVVTVALVIASGIASFVVLRGDHASLVRARDAFYAEHRFADVFAQLERAPDEVARELAEIPGVERVQTRVVESARLPLPGLSEPVRAMVASLPPPAEETLNAIRLRSGRRPEPGYPSEVVLLAGFAEAHGLGPGHRLSAVINGKLRELDVVGTADSPEYVLAIPAGAFTADPERFAVLWLSPDAIEAMFAMEGAFNDVGLALSPGASLAEVLAAVDRTLEPHGGLGAVARADQPSNHMLTGELSQLESMARFLPLIFLAVAALLVNVVLSRLVRVQQPEIATLKAVGYTNRQVGLHYVQLVTAIGVLGVALGVAFGAWLGAELLEVYGRFFELPELEFRLAPGDVAIAIGVSVGAALAGALGAVRRVVRLAPAEAMQPEAPARYRPSVLDRFGLTRAVGPSGQMILRELERRPLRALLSVVAIAAATALSVVAGWYYDGIERLVDTQFQTVMREDVAVTLLEPRPESVVRELSHGPGVIAVEGLRAVPVRFRAGARRRDGVIWGYPDGAELRQLRTLLGETLPLPPDGAVLTDVLAERLGVGVGDAIEVDIKEGGHARRLLYVSGLVDEPFGLQGHMRLEALWDWLGEEPLVSMLLVRVDPALGAELDVFLQKAPNVLEVTRRKSLLQRFREQSAGMIVFAAAIIASLAATITIGVVYNNARVALALRSRELASLRVLGFTRAEVSAILLGELAIQVCAAIPIGLVWGGWLVLGLASTIDPETYRLPVVLTPKTYAFAALVTLLAATASALLVRRRINRLDLVSVLKARE